MSSVTLSEEDLENHVVKGIDRWKRGDLFIDHGLSSNDAILEAGEKLPSKSDKSHPFNRFLDAVACDYAHELKMDKHQKKLVLRQLREKKKRWQQIVLRNSEISRSPNDSTPDPASSNDRVDKDEKVIETMETAVSRPIEINPKSRESHNSMLGEMNTRFEEANELRDVPSTVKNKFGKIYFSKLGKFMFPCLVVDPYSVEPGSVRDKWLDMFEKVSETLPISAS